MSFLHVLGQIGTGVGKIALKVVPAMIPGPIGVVVGAVSGVITSELTAAPNEQKKETAVSVAMSAATPDHIDTASKAQIVGSIVEAVLTIFNLLAKLFPSPAAPPVV